MELVIDEGTIRAGSVVRGRVMGTDRERIEVGLVPIESNRTARTTVAETIATAADGHRFELEIPTTAIEFAVAGVQVTWSVRAEVPGVVPGSAERRITIEPPDPDRAARPSDAEISRLVDAGAQKRRSLGTGEMVTAAMFMLMGLGLLGVGAFIAIRPPDSLEGSITPGLVVMAMSACFVLPGYIRIRSVYRPSTLRGVTVVDHSRSARRGEAVAITLTLESGPSVRVGYVTTVGVLHELRGSSGTTARGGGFVYSIAHESWRVVDSSNPTATFTVPADSPPSYSGQRVLVMHHLRVQPVGASSTKMNTRRLELPVAVVP